MTFRAARIRTAALRTLTVVGAAGLLLAACGDDDVSDAATVSLTSPAEGDSVAGSVQLTMAAEGITIEEAGEVNEGAGHFHVLADAGCLDADTTIGKDADTVHYGGGQTEGTIYLGPGEHELCLQVGDGVHSALDVTDTVSITVEISSRDEWCDVIGEVDELSTAVDEIEDFGAAQIGFENMSRLMDQLLDAMEFVDDEVRADLEGALEFGKDIAHAFVDAADFDAAFVEIEALYEAEGGDDEAFPGTDWVLDTCRVDLED